MECDDGCPCVHVGALLGPAAAGGGATHLSSLSRLSLSYDSIKPDLFMPSEQQGYIFFKSTNFIPRCLQGGYDLSSLDFF